MQGLWLCCSRMKALLRSSPPPKYRNIYFKYFQFFYISKHLQEVYRCHQFHHRLRARHEPAPVQCRFPSSWSRRDSTCCRSPKPWSQTTLLVQKKSTGWRNWSILFYFPFSNIAKLFFFVSITMNFVSNAQLVPNICHLIQCEGKRNPSLFSWWSMICWSSKMIFFFVSIATLCLIYILYNDLPPI